MQQERTKNNCAPRRYCYTNLKGMDLRINIWEENELFRNLSFDSNLFWLFETFESKDATGWIGGLITKLGTPRKNRTIYCEVLGNKK